MNENFDYLELELINEFKLFINDVKTFSYSGDSNWTFYLKRRIAELGREKKHKVAVGGFGDEFAAEWLYDIVWYNEDDDGCLIKIPLIVESEWDKKYSGIKFDFEKLLIGNAERRLMIWQAKEIEIESLFGKFKSAIDRFQENIGDRFLFAILNCDTDEEFIFKTYTRE